MMPCISEVLSLYQAASAWVWGCNAGLAGAGADDVPCRVRPRRKKKRESDAKITCSLFWRQDKHGREGWNSPGVVLL